MPLDHNRVPEEIRPLLSLAARWHIGDDFDREAAVSSVSVTELRELVVALEGREGDFLYEWLAGPEADSQAPSEEYLALTHMTMAADSAKVRMMKKQKTGEPDGQRTTRGM